MGYVPSHEELEAKERELRKKHDEDAMDIDFHGMNFQFKRDQQPSHWTAHQYATNNYEQQQQSVSMTDNYHSLEIAIFLFSFFIIAMVILCGICIIATFIGYT